MAEKVVSGQIRQIVMTSLLTLNRKKSDSRALLPGAINETPTHIIIWPDRIDWSTQDNIANVVMIIINDIITHRQAT